MKWTKDQIKDVYLLSPMQQGMLFHALMDEQSLTYREQIMLKMQGEVDIDLLQRSFQKLTDRHDMFRTVFVYDQVNKPMQVVLKEAEFPVIGSEDLTDLDPESQQERITWLKRMDLQQGFRLSEEVLIRIKVLRTGAEEYLLMWSFHHLILDGWCLGILLRELLAIYGALKHEEPIRLEPAPRFSTYMKWLEKQDAAAARSYWTGYVQGYDQLAALPRRFGVREGDIYEQREYSFQLDAEVTGALRELGYRYQVTISTLIQTMWAVLLHTYTHLDDVMFGAVVSGRPADVPGIESMLGLFINTIPVRMRMNGELPFAELLKQAGRNEQASAEYDYYPLYETQSASLMKQGLIDHILVFENFPLEGAMGGGTRERIGFEPVEVEAFEQTNYDLNVLFVPGERLGVKLLYNANAFDSDFFERLEGHFVKLAESVVTDPLAKIGSCVLLREEEYRQIVHAFNDTARDYPKDRLIHQGFERKAAETPDHPAIITDHETVSYRELNERANRIARCLRETGVGPGTHVGLLVSRSVGMIAAMLGIAKSGGAYVPMEPSTPTARIERIMNTLGATHLVTERPLETVSAALYASCPALSAVLFVDEAESMLAGYDGGDLPAAAEPDHTAYVIFTSGSTGVPKGVIVAHRTVSNLIDWVNRTTEMGADDRLLFVTSPTFDLSVYDVFGLLTAGGTIRLAGVDEVRQPDRLLQLLLEEPITCWDSAPAALQQLAPLLQAKPGKAGGRLRLVLLSGDWIPLKLPGVLKEAFPGVRVLALGGATEATVWSNMFEVDEVRPEWASIPYGKPIQNARYYILDPGLQPCPIGVPGELYIGGDCLAVGYDDPQLTAERFLPDPFAAEASGFGNSLPHSAAAEAAAASELGGRNARSPRMYRTGDRARWMPDGHIEFLGRIDHQVKIRGYRIETGEIQSQLVHHPSVREAIVIDRQDEAGEKYLCAYLVAEEELTVRELRGFLADSLPEYMIPSYFVRLPSMPVTANGKLDRKALPEPDGSIGSGAAYVAPRNEVEAKLAAIWQEVLQCEVGVQDHFIELGGHSIKATMLIARIHKQLQISLPIRAVFHYPTIEEMARLILQTERRELPDIERLPQAAAYPASSAQRRMYILQQLEGGQSGYHIPGIFEVEGEMDLFRFERAWHQLIERHESLRTSFEMIEGELLQRVHAQVDFRIDYETIDHSQLSTRIAAFFRPYDLSQAPLMRAGLLSISRTRHILLFDMHHLIADGESMRIFAEEFVKLYAGERLEELNVQYKDYAAWQQGYLQSEEMERQEAYWLDRYRELPSSLRLPTDFPRPAERSFAGESFRFRLNPELTAALVRLAERTDVTLYMLLLSAYFILLRKYAGQEDIVVGTPSGGRPHPDTAPLIGLFVNTLAIRSQVEDELPFLHYVKKVRELALSAYEHADYPFELLVERSGAERDLSRNPLFDTMFTLQTDPPMLDIAGLTFKPYEFEAKMAQFDFTFEAIQHAHHIEVHLEYSTDLFRRETIQRMADHYSCLLECIASEPYCRIDRLDMVTEAEKREIRTVFNATETAYPQNTTFLQLFAQQAEASPERIAVRYLDRALTYQELDERSGRLAAALVARGVGVESIAAVMAERSVDWVVAVLAAFKAGAAFVPIDPAYPAERIEHMLRDSQAAILLTQSALLRRSEGFAGKVLDLDAYEAYAEGPIAWDPRPHPDRLAYVIYTSGTTGKPKGVMVEHGSYANLAFAYRDAFAMDTFPVTLLQLASFSFDVFLADLARTLTNGGELVLCPEDVKLDPTRLYETIRAHRITVLDMPPALAVPFMDHVFDHGLELGDLKLLVIGSDSCPAEEYGRLLARFGSKLRIVNCYGVTEACVDTSYYEETADRFTSVGTVPIGKPFANMRMYVVDNSLQLQPVGVVGELCIGGAGVARGYLNKAELTAAAFLEGPFHPGGRLYRTGDLAKWREDGQVEFVGRADDQLKIRGFRIEPGEIESALLAHPGVKQAVVIALDEAGTKALCAYIVASALELSELRDHLRARIPEHMIPSYFMCMERLPLTSNGKVDRRALPKPDGQQLRSAEYVPPRSKAEQAIAEIWRELLQVELVGLQDDFFALGGNSLKAARMASLVSTKLGAELTLRTVFQQPTLRQLAAAIDRGVDNSSKLPTLWNEPGHPPLFCFPPLFGYGFVFQELAACLSGAYSLYAFDFVEEEDRIARYADEMMALQEQGPCWLLGYSAGGNLAFEAAAELERREVRVAGIILLDAIHREPSVRSQADIDDEIRMLLQEAASRYGLDPGDALMRERERLIGTYARYAESLVHRDRIRAELHDIRSEERDLQGTAVLPWSVSTYGPSMDYAGAGAHLDMLSPPHVARNAEKIQAILQRIPAAGLVGTGEVR
ncbi:non-ribosomal peptide synthetase [Paenibacillus puerhi]|uniref:non-ribosomal peptide synthetase n=1 Tax=Paenibacillus puerhi TaxID=2692622 RepID=UPI00135B8D10|nr:non-ribosomal peptide synthetase [Paenibacillus puerhi]